MERDPARDALTDAHADLLRHAGIDPVLRRDPQRVAAAVQQHQAAAAELEPLAEPLHHGSRERLGVVLLRQHLEHLAQERVRTLEVFEARVGVGELGVCLVQVHCRGARLLLQRRQRRRISK